MNKDKQHKIDAIDLPEKNTRESTHWGSDVIAGLLRKLDIPFVALNPGASFRGLHDSLVNVLGNTRPKMLLCLHEEHAVAIAHGFAKVSEKPMGVILHSNVGLMHGSMAIFNAWCDRVPMMIMGATGPVDAAKRRPWIDWIHTARDQAAIIRHYIKWDDTPGSVAAMDEAMLKANFMATTPPKGPVYVCLDVALQEQQMDNAPVLPQVHRFSPPPSPVAQDSMIEKAARLLTKAKKPIILAGRVSRSVDAWNLRIKLAEALQAIVLTDIKTAAAFPGSHPLHSVSSQIFPSSEAQKRLGEADLILSLDWVDLAGTLKMVWPDSPVSADIIQVSIDHHNHNGWSMDHFGMPPADLFLASEPDLTVPLLLDKISGLTQSRPGPGDAPAGPADKKERFPENGNLNNPITLEFMAQSLKRNLGKKESCLVRFPLKWDSAFWEIAHPLDFLGYDGGAGIGSGPGMVVGAALALMDTDRLAVAILGDGDYLMGVTALWTAVHFKIPLLILVANNQSYFNDELHQERMALQRNRPVPNKWIGQAISNPEVDLAGMAKAQGAEGYGPVKNRSALLSTLPMAVESACSGKVCVVDVHISQ